MTTEIIEGDVIEDEPIRAVVVAQPGQALVAQPDRDPAELIGRASALASALNDIVERQRLYATIQGKKYPQVEAWQTIGRLDNVVAREAERPIRNEDGSYEAFVELVRLSDGMIVGRASALCGTAGDRPWDTRAEPARRSMAVTRATSRAFRLVYSWIMALAGYEPTPADEMPDARGETHAPGESIEPAASGETLIGRVRRRGIVRKGTAAGYKLEARQGPDGHVIGCRLEIDSDKNIPQVLFMGPVGEALFFATAGKADSLVGKPMTVAGVLYHVKAGQGSWYRLHVDAFEAADVIYPAPVEEPATPMVDGALGGPELFTADDMAEVDAQAGAA